VDSPNSEKLGQFSVSGKIAQGGAGDIYLAEDPIQKQRVAIKKLREEFAYDRDFIHLMKSEFETLSALDHPSIIKALGFQSGGEEHYIILEYVDGLDLRAIFDFLDQNKMPFPLPAALEIAYQLSGALEYLHQFESRQGAPIVHSDLNPRNILVNREGRLKLIDFSIAQTGENKLGDTAGVGRGVITHMSPEQAKSEGIDSRSDIFSFGVLLYEMLKGEIPFPGRNRFEVYCNLMSKEITAKDLEGLHPLLQHIVAKCLQKRPQDRFQDIREVREGLGSLLHGQLQDGYSEAKKLILEIKKAASS